MNVNWAYKTVIFTVWVTIWNPILWTLPPLSLAPIYQTLCSGESRTQSQVSTASFNSVKPSIPSSVFETLYFTLYLKDS